MSFFSFALCLFGRSLCVCILGVVEINFPLIVSAEVCLVFTVSLSCGAVWNHDGDQPTSLNIHFSNLMPGSFLMILVIVQRHHPFLSLVVPNPLFIFLGMQPLLLWVCKCASEQQNATSVSSTCVFPVASTPASVLDNGPRLKGLSAPGLVTSSTPEVVPLCWYPHRCTRG